MTKNKAWTKANDQLLIDMKALAKEFARRSPHRGKLV